MGLVSILLFSQRCLSRLSSQSRKVLTLYSKEDCTLCEEAKEDLLASGLDVELKEVDITEPENSKWFGLYRYEIPVFYLEDKFLSKNFLDLKELEKRLSQS